MKIMEIDQWLETPTMMLRIIKKRRPPQTLPILIQSYLVTTPLEVFMISVHSTIVCSNYSKVSPLA
jgi:hypothetical protein